VIFFAFSTLAETAGMYRVFRQKGRDLKNTVIYRKIFKKKYRRTLRLIPGCGVGKTKTGPPRRGSVVILVFVVHIRPQVLFTGRVPEIIFNRPQVTEGVVLHVPFTPLHSIPPLSAVPVRGVAAPAGYLASFAFTHVLSPHLRDSVGKKLKIQSTFWE
jgi:hypothetical protein